MILLMLMLSLAFTKKEDRNKDFRILSASIQTSYGGAAGSGSVSTYTIRLKARRSFVLNCDSGYAAGRKSQLYVMADSIQMVSSKKVKCGEEVILKFSIQDEVYLGGGDYQMVIPGSDSSAIPIMSKTGVAIRYSGGKNKLMAINKLSISTPIYAP